jgi:hypothetical protein
MVPIKSQDVVITIVAALLRDIQTSHSEVFTPRACRLTTEKIVSRYTREGMSFLTKTLPRLGKALDRALTGVCTMNSKPLGFKTQRNSELPIFMGELFNRIFSNDGRLLPVPCVASIIKLRQLLYLFYKYKLPYSIDEEQKVLDSFRKVESEISCFNDVFGTIAEAIDCNPQGYTSFKPVYYRGVIRKARRLLARVFASFDPKNIHPSHGPGAVSTRERLWNKYDWTCIPDRLSTMYPIDAYFYASLGHVCDNQAEINSLLNREDSARVILVPKDSRGPRLISCEPLVFQWIQQGLGRAIVKHVERHSLTRENVRFTDQQPNRMGALAGSSSGKYATLDLKDASDRITVGLVRLLFPEPLLEYLLASRSLSTIMPNGEVICLNKFAPMGSALCFPVLALTIWAILTAGLTDAYSRKRVYVYGDDVIVPTAQAENAMILLESFGLAINRDKSCYHGFFRESCGLDAYKGKDVTPVRFRTLWSSTPNPDAYVSWISYANSMYERGYHHTYDVIVEELIRIYRIIPEKRADLFAPSLYEVPEGSRKPRTRYNADLQLVERYVLDVQTRPTRKTMSGWRMLLRYFAEATSDTPCPRSSNELESSCQGLPKGNPFSVGVYTKRHASVLVWCWR